MKTVSILFAGNNSAHMFDATFNGKSAFDLSVSWANSVENTTGIVIFANTQTVEKINCNFAQMNNSDGENCDSAQRAKIDSSKITIVTKEKWTVKTLFEEISKICREKDAKAVYAFADCPFLSDCLTKELVQTHEKYVAEYTFADGYPYGFAPEIIDGGTAGILASLCANTQKELGEKLVSRDTIFAALKTDINSFEIETVLAPEDWRLYRLSFACDTREKFLACRALYEEIQNIATNEKKSVGDALAEMSPADLTRLAIKNESVLKTVPAFYNVQICERVVTDATYSPYSDFYKKAHGGTSHENGSFMPLEKFSALVDEISDFSEKSVISLSCWGEPLLHLQFTDFVKTVVSKSGLSVLIETDGHLVTEELCKKIKSICDEAASGDGGFADGSFGKIIWIVTLDAFTEETYKRLRVANAPHVAEVTLANASKSVAILSKYFAGNVYPQMTRLDTNEHELESFYRFWSDKNSPSGGKIIIQKYDSFCGILPDRKPADLSPIGRKPCWHLRRDMNILCDGNVPRCHEFYSSNIVGNVFEESVEQVWKKMNLTEIEECKKCDEYYTYNF